MKKAIKKTLFLPLISTQVQQTQTVIDEPVIRKPHFPHVLKNSPVGGVSDIMEKFSVTANNLY